MLYLKNSFSMRLSMLTLRFTSPVFFFPPWRMHVGESEISLQLTKTQTWRSSPIRSTEAINLCSVCHVLNIWQIYIKRKSIFGRRLPLRVNIQICFEITSRQNKSMAAGRNKLRTCAFAFAWLHKWRTCHLALYRQSRSAWPPVLRSLPVCPAAGS